MPLYLGKLGKRQENCTELPVHHREAYRQGSQLRLAKGPTQDAAPTPLPGLSVLVEEVTHNRGWWGVDVSWLNNQQHDHSAYERWSNAVNNTGWWYTAYWIPFRGGTNQNQQPFMDGLFMAENPKHELVTREGWTNLIFGDQSIWKLRIGWSFSGLPQELHQESCCLHLWRLFSCLQKIILLELWRASNVNVIASSQPRHRFAKIQCSPPKLIKPKFTILFFHI